MNEDWSDFTIRLATVLADLATRERTVVLVIADREEPTCFVQYSCGGEVGGIWAEISSNDFRPKHRRLSKEDEKRLRADGWDRPGGPWWARFRRSLPNWSCSRFADPRADHRQLAGMTVTALRDIMRIGSPLALTYDAFVQETGEPITLEGLGIPRQVG